jgi:predicted glycoside hydrolase/deacetylase ChbG (UPF0249 family)
MDGAVGSVSPVDGPTLAQRLGYRADERLLIVNCDDLGSSHAANVGVYDALRDGIATSASLMVPCPWAREAAARYQGEDVGVHLTLNAEWDLYRWGPITRAPSLHDGDGGFPRTVEDLWDHADLDEVRRELRAQIERAILWGFDVSHLDSHLGTMSLRPEFFDVQLELCLEFGLPMRAMPKSFERIAGFPFRRLAAEEGVVFPDQLVLHRNDAGRTPLPQLMAELRPGVTELTLHPSVETPELCAFNPDWKNRVDDHRVATADADLRDAITRHGITMIGYEPLRELQRSG